ncbi:hypothetical protein BDV96DRAFT_480133, partial [Lophiotrema nucula]
FYIADTGVGHRSSPVPQWRTSIRRLSTNGTSPVKIIEFGSTPPAEPIGATALTYDPNAKHIYIATGTGIVRTDLDGSNHVTISTDYAASLTISGNKLYYGVSYDGLIKRSNLDGTNPEVFLNVSNGINYNIVPSYIPAYNIPAGLAIDKENKFIYWSSSTTTSGKEDQGTISRAPLKAQGTLEPKDVEVLVEKIEVPSQLRLIGSYLYWIEKGRWSNSVTSIKRAKFPTSKVKAPQLSSHQEVVVSSDQSDIFFGTDFVPEKNTLWIRSFAVDEERGKLWFAMESDLRVMFAKIVETELEGGELRVVDGEVGDVGIPVGLEYVR